LTSEQLEAARAERMRQNGLGTLTLEDARTWIEETGLCLFLPRKQFSASVAPSFVEAIAGQQDATPQPRQIAAAEELLVRLEADGVAVRLNLQGIPGEQPDFIVATWVLPYVYALRGDRDWRRNPQLTGSRAVSQLAVQTYKILEQGDATVAQLKHALGREVSEVAVVRAITELWQQLRIIPAISAPGNAAKWQLLRTRYQKAIAEGASTSQVTAISVLASIYLQAVIAASMEEVEIFLSPLTARSKVREVLRGLAATRQVHTISMGPAPHFYVAGTLPEFSVAPTIFGNSTLSASSYFLRDHEEHHVEPVVSHMPTYAAPQAPKPVEAPESHAPRTPIRKPVPAAKPAAARPHFSRPAHRDRKPASAKRPGQSSEANRGVRRGADARPSASRNGNGSHWGKSTAKNGNGNHKGAHSASSNGHSNGHGNGHSDGHASGNQANGSRNGKASTSSWNKLNGHSKTAKPGAKSSTGARKARPDSRVDARANRGSRKPARSGAKSGGKRFGFSARPKQVSKKRG
jgi:23S rRNA pseudouridine2605 synthase